MSEIQTASNEEIVRISSREVTEMMEVSKHSDMLSKIEKLNEVLENGKIRSQDYWIENSYKVDGNNKTYKEYLVSKKGCELLAHKSTGEKGVLFTVKYMKKFEEMEIQLKNPYFGISKELQAIFIVDKKQQEQEQRILNIEDKMTVNYELAENLRTEINSKAVEILGGKDAEAYKKLSKKLYSAFHKDIKRTFKVNSYKNLSVKNYDSAINYIENWELKDEVLKYAINGLNSQIAFA